MKEERSSNVRTLKGSAGDTMSTNNGIRKVVIPAAGLGTRFLPITKAQPKEMLPVVDKPVIQYVVEEAVKSGFDDIIIITGRNKRSIEDHFDRCHELEERLSGQNGTEPYAKAFFALEEIPEIHYIRQREQKGLGDAVLLAEKHCDDEPFAVLLGDTITIEPIGCETCTSQMNEVFKKYGKSVVAVEEVPDYKLKDYGIIDGELAAPNIYVINSIIEKPAPEIAPSNLGAIGRYIFTSEIFDCIHKVRPGYGGEIQLTDAIRMLDHPLGLVTNCIRYDIGDKPGWMKAWIELTLGREEFHDDILCFMQELLKKEEMRVS